MPENNESQPSQAEISDLDKLKHQFETKLEHFDRNRSYTIAELVDYFKIDIIILRDFFAQRTRWKKIPGSSVAASDRFIIADIFGEPLVDLYSSKQLPRQAEQERGEGGPTPKNERRNREYKFTQKEKDRVLNFLKANPGEYSPNHVSIQCGMYADKARAILKNLLNEGTIKCKVGVVGESKVRSSLYFYENSP